MDVYDNIEDYLSGKLSGKQLADFEQALVEDLELRSLVDNYKQVKSVSSNLLENELMSEVIRVSKSIESDGPLKIEEQYNENAQLAKWFLVALAAFGFVMLVSYFMTTINSNGGIKDVNQFVAEVYREPLWPAKRGNGKDEYLSLGVQAFNTGDEAQAIAYLSDSVSQSAEGKYWLAELYLKDKQYEESIKYLPPSIEGNLYSNRILFLRMLNYAGLGKMEEAKKIYLTLSPEYKKLVPEYIFSK